MVSPTPEQVRDASAVGGLLLIFTGCALVSVPLGFVVLGVLVLSASLWGHYHEPPRPPAGKV